MLRRLLLWIIPLALSVPGAGAEVHLQKFNGPTPSNSHPEEFAPEGWGRIVDSFEKWGDGPWYIKYQLKTSGGKDGAYLQAPRQRLVHPDDEYEYKDTYDLLVTPMLMGDISFWLKAALSTSYTYAEVYACTESGDTYTRGELLKTIKAADLSSNEWRQYTMHLDSPTCLGLRLSYVSIDEFSGELPVMAASMSITGATLIEEEPMPDPDGNSTVAYDVEITNTGSQVLNPGDEGYSLTIEQYYDERVAVGTTPVPVALNPGASTTVRVSAKVPAIDRKFRYRFDIVENLGGTRFDGKWITICPYTPELKMEIASPLTFGFLTDQPVSRTFAIVSDGGAPMTVTGITLPAGYSMSGASLPLTLAPGERQEITLTLGTDIKGACAGDMTIAIDGLPDTKCQLAGGVISDDSYFVDFEQGLPANMLQLDPLGYKEMWEVLDVPAVYGADAGLGAKCVNCFGMAMLVTPRLTLREGEQIIFNAAQESYSSVLKVYWSQDRITWHEVLDIGGRDEYGDSPKEHMAYFSNVHVDKAYSENYVFGQFVAGDFPAGNVYLAFEAGRARIDNILAGRLSPDAVDFIIEGHLHPDRGIVNHPAEARVIIRNLGTKPLKAADYTVTLSAGDELVPHTALTDIAPGATADYTIAYTPHVHGDFPVSVSVKCGDTEISTPVTTLSVRREEALDCHTAGTPDGRSFYCPLNTANLNSCSQSIYTAAELGLNKGDEVLKLAFAGYTLSDKQAVYDLTLWLVNTDATTVTAATARATDDIVPVYTGKWAPYFGGSNDNFVDILEINLPDGFIYTGDNVMVILEAHAEDFKVVYFQSTKSGQSIVRYSDSADSYKTMEWEEQSGRAVARFYTAMDVPTISGTVTDIDSNPVAGVALSLTSGDVLYTAVTGADGTYSIAPIQHTLGYTLTVSAEGYVTPEPMTVSFDKGDISHDITLLTAGQAAIGAVEDDTDAAVTYYNLQGIRVDCNEMPAGVYIRRQGNSSTKVYVK